MNVALPVGITPDAQAFLAALAEELAIPPSRYEQANDSYKSLGDWLNREGSTVKQFDPHVYSQGSFRLGTVIRPVSDEEDYDVDSVCELRRVHKSHVTQEQLKALVGQEVRAYRKAQAMIKPVREGRRCWVLDYADGAQFHMDIVPALRNGDSARLLLELSGLDARWAASAIVITDNQSKTYRVVTDDWPRSNPKGYADWFRSRMAVAFERRRRKLAEGIRAGVEAIPDHKVVTPLQQAIMVLKRHRDMTFIKDGTNKPISVILTTLAAQSYSGEDNIGAALTSILSRAATFITYDNGVYFIPNPTDPLENFADKWAEHPERAQAFFDWLQLAQSDFYRVARLTNLGMITEAVTPGMGLGVANRAGARVGSGTPAATTSRLRPATLAPAAPVAFPPTRRSPTEPDGFGGK